ncbi:ACP S-malonyltransferase [Corallococcus sp. ZKHCc1 1396]|uniref:[acyl-carrier-protein] S-malonyltransferase n=1 Tax=Corallococcus soli TaxID=2710757 RepID=A0ABR9PVQ5_9BACT|nr:ACP S-malonyltransferase [Corallococcus soli]MBE4751867.1 ACP S-malonyltransferase [Corallococcus soli]
MVTFVFPGQGAQKKGMGKVLFDAFPEQVRIADEVLGYSIRTLCELDPERQLAQTQFTQPALYVVGALAWMKRQAEGARAPDFVAGHSLGEYNALLVAGVFDFATGLRLVKRRGELMSQANGGAMAAVIGLDETAIRGVLSDARLTTLDVANLNTPSQTVIAGPREDIIKAQEAFDKRGGRYVVLNVSAPFHSRYMRPAQEAFSEFLQGFTFKDPSIPVIANTTARPYVPGSVRANLSEQLRSPVRWCETVRYLLARGVSRFDEVGESEVLTKMVGQIQKEAGPLELRAELASPVAVPSVRAAQEPVVAGRPAPASVRLESVRDVAAPARPLAEATPVRELAPAVRATEPAAPARPRSDGGRAHAASTPASEAMLVRPDNLGSEAFRREYQVRYAYYAGSMYRGIASEELVARMARAGLLAFYGTAGLSPERVERAITDIRASVGPGLTFGMNLLSTGHESELVELFLRHGVDVIEASAYVQLTPALVKYRLAGLSRRPDGSIAARNRLIAKVSRPEVAEGFFAPAPERLVKKLLERGEVTAEQADLARHVPLADDVCVEADSGGHTDQGVAYVLMPAMLRLRDAMAAKHGYKQVVRVGAAGGIGTPEAAAAALMLGADFLVTGSINQCTVEAGHSDAVKDLLEKINVQDTDYAPAGDMFEMGARVQVLKKGVFFPARANRLYDLYRNFNSLDELDEATRRTLQEKYFKRSFEAVFEEVRQYKSAAEVEKAERDPKYKMRLIFKWYFAYTNRLAFKGERENQVDFQVHCGSALGAFNQWVKGTPLEGWRARHVDELAEKLMTDTAHLLGQRMRAMMGHPPLLRATG